MNCTDSGRLLDDLAAGATLPVPFAQGLRAHCERCASCGSRLEAISEARLAEAREIMQGNVPPPTDDLIPETSPTHQMFSRRMLEPGARLRRTNKTKQRLPSLR
jgi:hypothetical protein